MCDQADHNNCEIIDDLHLTISDLEMTIADLKKDVLDDLRYLRHLGLPSKTYDAYIKLYKKWEAK